ncbi:flagellar hook-basal body complex protein [Magnetovibrio sp. PR-2]|uniref:flagellar hook-basal body complex protein n=1 Tax=Magnetovibrio sp. PR-2 TaxID=3120356 RepID=UPI002FCE4C23
MSLYGALFSGVSGLTAQSSAMGAISDNITNVSTIGYKGTTVNFQTLVTKQTSSTFYSAGGVQSSPRQSTDVQGLLQASTSSTDIAISGSGFFVVNEANVPGVSDPYLFTRAGSFIQDDEGYLKNAQGYYLQGWPTNASGTVIPANNNLSIANQNIISSDYMESINLNRVGGTATATSTIAIGANLPSTATTFDGTLSDITNQLGYQKTDVQFFDSLGGANTMSFEYLRSGTGNQWDVAVEPPSGTQVLTLYDQENGTNSSDVYMSKGHLEFTGTRPPDGSTVSINGITYEFDLSGDGTTSGPVQQIDTVVLGGAANIATGDIYYLQVGSETVSFTVAGTTTTAAVAAGLANAVNTNATLSAQVTAAAADPNVTITGDTAGAVFTSSVSVYDANNDSTVGTVTVSTTQTPSGNVIVDTSGNTSLSSDLDTLVSRVQAVDPEFSTSSTTNAFGPTDTQYHMIAKERGSSNNIVITGGPNHLGDISVNITSLLDSSSNPLTTQGTAASKAFTVQAVNTFGKTAQIDTVTAANVAATDVLSVTLHGVTVSYTATGTTATAAHAGLANAINSHPFLSERVTATSSAANLTITSDYTGLGYTTTTTPTNTSGGTAPTLTVATTTSNSTGALAFDSDGVPASFNAADIEIIGFSSGAQDMNDATGEGAKITLDFGDVDEANGMTQFGSEFTPDFITQNGSKFGTFAGVTIGADGLVTALFDNGETRKIFQIPVATFVNPNQLESKSGNVWTATQASGDYTLREPDNGPAGQVVQAALEASTVDIGTEFTNMIVVQRAYSASTKIITTADQMLEELMRTK